MNIVNEKMKLATWALFERARNIEPSVCVPGTRQFVSHLMNVFQVADFHGLDKELWTCRDMVDDAWTLFSKDNDWGEAFKRCMPALDMIGHIAFDERFSTPDERPFTAPGEVMT
jgi:hypothetical protein